MTNKLDIYINGLPLGSLEFEARRNLVFHYKEAWLNRKLSFPISRSLPLREEAFHGEKVFVYFDNLLPDNISVRQRIAARMRAASDQVFDLLAVVGRDCVGALQFVKTTEALPVLSAAKGIKISDTEIAAKLRGLRLSPLAVSQEEDFRLSIAGVQDKTAFLFLSNKWHTPLGATPTTHIFKPQISELRPGLDFLNSVENEWLCSRILSAFGLPVTNCKIKSFEDIKVLIVERFDRAWSKNKLVRLPQEDLCQAFSVANFGKYESDGGPGISTIMELLNESNNPSLDRQNFLKTQIVFFLLAAIDGHAKNFSIGWRPSGFSLSPLYDVLSAQPIIDSGKYPFEKLKMAMAVGKNRHYRIREIHKRHFLQTAKICRFDQAELNRIIDDCVDSLESVIEKVRSELNKDFPVQIAESVFAGMRIRTSHLTNPN